MNRWAGLAVVGALLVVAWLGFSRPELFPGALDVPQLVYLLMALLLVSGAGYGFSRIRFDGGRALISILFWFALIAAIMLIYSWFN